MADAFESSHPLSIETDDPDKILSKFDSISYDKGASIIRMMENFVGTDVFYEGIRQYLEKFKYQNAAKVFFKNGPNPGHFFCLFSFFSHDKYSTNTINEKSCIWCAWDSNSRAAGWKAQTNPLSYATKVFV